MKPNKDLDKAINHIKRFLNQQWVAINKLEEYSNNSFSNTNRNQKTFAHEIFPFKDENNILNDYEPYNIHKITGNIKNENLFLPKPLLNYGFQTKIESISKNDSDDLILKITVTNLLETKTFEHILKKHRVIEKKRLYEMDKFHKPSKYFRDKINLEKQENIDINIFVNGNKDNILKLISEKNLFYEKLPNGVSWEFESFSVANKDYYSNDKNDDNSILMNCYLKWNDERGNSYPVLIILKKNFLPLFYLEQFISDFENKWLPKINTLNGVDWKYLEHVDPKIHASDIKDTAQLKALFCDDYFDPNKDNDYNLQLSNYGGSNYDQPTFRVTLVKLVENSADDQMGTLKALFDFAIPDFNIHQFREITFYGFKRKVD